MQGSQTPRFESVPDYHSSTGKEAVELAAMAGLVLDPWQQHVLINSLGEKADGSWAAFEVALVVARQNGKDAILEARELAGLFMLGERLIIHSAHQWDTSLEHFLRLLFLIENTPDFDQRVLRVSRAHGEEAIWIRGGQRIRFRTRAKGGGRGFSGDLVIFNEAMILPAPFHGNLLPTLSARPNPQAWYAGSPVDQYVHESGLVLARLRERGLGGDDPSLVYFEWSADADSPSKIDSEMAVSHQQWADANPGLGIRITLEHVANEQRSMDARTFAVERLGVGDWPDTSGEQTVLSLEMWRKLVDPASEPVERLCFAFDVAPDRSMGTIAVAGARTDELAHVEAGEYRRGTGWIVPKCVDLTEKHPEVTFVCDGSGPAASLIPELEAAGVTVLVVTAKEHAQACGLLYDAVEQAKLRHLGTPELSSAVRGAEKRPLGEAWAWSRRNSSVDISPLVAVTLAHWGHLTIPAVSDPEPMVAFA